MRTAPSAIKACLREAATPLHLLGLYWPLNSKRPSLRSLMYLASRKCPPLSRRSISRLRGIRPWCIVHKLATPQELAGLLGPQMPGTIRGPPQPHLKPKRYALQIWLEVEVGPEYFLPPEDDSCSTDFTLEVLNRTYPGCTGVYLDRGGHMLAFYGRKGSPKAGLIQVVAIEASHSVTEIPTWMGLTAKWRVKCVSLAEDKDILAGCKRLEQENRRWERQSFQERFASLHQASGLSVTVAPFQPRATIPTPRPAETASDQHKPKRRGPKASLSPSHRLTTSSVGKVPSPIRGPYPQTSDDDATSDVGLVDPSSRKKGRRSRGNRGSRSGESLDSSHSARSSTSSGGRRKKKDGFSSKIQIPEFGGKKGHLGDVTDASEKAKQKPSQPGQPGPPTE